MAADWTFMTNHGHVLLCILRDRDVRIRELARDVGISERAVQGIVADLVDAGYVRRIRAGRRNRYELDPEQHFRHPVEQSHRIGELLQVFHPAALHRPTPPRVQRTGRACLRRV